MKVFGIGLQKTGTTSLNTALNILGYNSKHFVPELICPEFYHSGAPQDKKLSYKEFDYNILNTNNALTDNPICVPELWKALEKKYPDSKFILTIRDKEKWIASVVKHIEQNNYLDQLHSRISNYTNYNPDKDVLPTADNIGMLEYVYRTPYKKIDEDFLRKFYDDYIQEVRGHFHRTPEKLLIMNFENNAGWKEITEFLNVAIPKQAFPHNHKTYPRFIKWIVRNLRPYLPAKLRSNLRMFYIALDKKINSL